MKDLIKNKSIHTQLNKTVEVQNKENKKKFEIGVSLLIYENIQILITISDS